MLFYKTYMSNLSLMVSFKDDLNGEHHRILDDELLDLEADGQVGRPIDGSQGGGLVCVDALAEVSAHGGGEDLLDLGHTGGGAHQDDLADDVHGEAGRLEGGQQRGGHALHDVGGHLFKLFTGYLPK